MLAEVVLGAALVWHPYFSFVKDDSSRKANCSVLQCHPAFLLGWSGWNYPPIVRELSRRPGRLLSGKFDIDKLG